MLPGAGVIAKRAVLFAELYCTSALNLVILLGLCHQEAVVVGG